MNSQITYKAKSGYEKDNVYLSNLQNFNNYFSLIKILKLQKVIKEFLQRNRQKYVKERENKFVVTNSNIIYY